MSWLSALQGAGGAAAGAGTAASSAASGLGSSVIPSALTPSSGFTMSGAAPSMGPTISAANSLPASPGIFSKIGEYLKTDGGKAAMEAGTQAGQQSSAEANAAGKAAAAQGLSAFTSQGIQTPQQVMPVYSSSNYNPMELMERLAAFKGR